MLLTLDKHAQIFVIVKNEHGKTCVNHYVVEPNPEVKWELDELGTAPVEFYWALDLMRDCNPDADGKLPSAHIGHVDFVTLMLGEGNFVFDTTSQFVYPYLLTGEFRDHFMTVIEDEKIPYYRHTK